MSILGKAITEAQQESQDNKTPKVCDCIYGDGACEKHAERPVTDTSGITHFPPAVPPSKEARALPHDRQNSLITSDSRELESDEELRPIDDLQMTIMRIAPIDGDQIDDIMSEIEQYISKELAAELGAIQEFNQTVGNSLPWGIGVGAYIEGRLQSLKPKEK